MKESEMRARIEKLIEKALRVAAVPASVGFTMALGGCGPVDITPVDGGQGGMTVVPVYSAPVPDPGPIAKYMGPMPDPVPDDAGAVVKYMGPMPVDPVPDDAGPVARYMGPMPVDPDPGPVTRYMGPMPG